MKPAALRGLYVITPTLYPSEQILIGNVAAAIEGGARIVQFRDKSADRVLQQQTASALVQLCRARQTLFLVNDDVELARAVGADGVHLGQDDMSLADARRQLGDNAIIGVTCHNSLTAARVATQGGADYVAFGRFFPSRTKPDASAVDVEILHRARQQLDLPVVAIGGITSENGGRLIEAGADMLAVVDGVFGQTDIAAAAARFACLF